MDPNITVSVGAGVPELGTGICGIGAGIPDISGDVSLFIFFQSKLCHIAGKYSRASL